MCNNKSLGFLGDVETYVLTLHLLSMIEVPTHILGFYCILFKTPPKMESIKWSMIILHFCSTLLDVYMSILVQPVLFLPVSAGFSCGIIQHFGVTTDIQVFCGVTLIGVTAVAILGFFENRYNRLVIGDQYSKHRKLKRTTYILFNYLMGFTFFIPAYLEIPDQELGKVYLKNAIPCLPTHFLNQPNFFILTISPTVPTLCLIVSNAAFALQCLFFVLHIIAYLKKSRITSPTTYRMQKAFLQALAIQISLPFLILCIPVWYVIASLLFEYYNQVEMVSGTNYRLLIEYDSKESNPTLFSVFLSKQLEKMELLEIILYAWIIIIASIFNVVCLIIVARSNVFHNNLKCTIWWTMGAWFELVIEKCFTIFYQQILMDNDIDNNRLVLLAWSASFHYHFIFLVMASPLMIIVERGLATHYLLDYEKRKRRWIMIASLFFQNSFAGILTILTVFNIFRYVHAAIIGAIAISISSICFICLNKLNRNKLESIEKYNQNLYFNLSAKYQLRENVKTFKLIKILFLTVIATIFFLVTLKTVPMVLEIPDKTKFLFKRITDMIVLAGPIFVALIMVTAVEDYNIVARRFFGVQRLKVVPMLDLKAEQGDIYFDQFKFALR